MSTWFWCKYPPVLPILTEDFHWLFHQEEDYHRHSNYSLNIVLTDVCVRVLACRITLIWSWITKDISCRLDEKSEEKHLDVFVRASTNVCKKRETEKKTKKTAQRKKRTESRSFVLDIDCLITRQFPFAWLFYTDARLRWLANFSSFASLTYRPSNEAEFDDRGEFHCLLNGR